MKIVTRIFLGLAGLAVLVSLFYIEEDWRGRRAWEICKRDLEARGFVLDWSKFIAPPVPPDQNFFAAPKMAEWFVRPEPGGNASNELTSIRFAGFRPKPCQIAEVTVVPVSTNAIPPESADIAMRYYPLRAPNFFSIEVEKTNVSPAEFPIPLIQFVDVPLTVAIINLARQAEINFILDPKIQYGRPDHDGKISPEPRVSIRWENISGRKALLALLDNYGLKLVYDANNGVARITANTDPPQTYAAGNVHKQLTQLFAGVIGTNFASVYGDHLICSLPPQAIKPMRVVVESDILPDTNEVRGLFRESFPNNDADAKYLNPRIRVEPNGSNVFRVMLDTASATEYLAWSDRFGPDFDSIREALKRPDARMDGDYSAPDVMPVQNFVAIRIVAQALAERAKCNLLLGRPEAALRELTLVHDLCRLSEVPPGGRPITLVAAMIDVAIHGLYAGVIQDGFRLNGWRKPQLVELQKQCERVDLSRLVAEAINTESVATTHALQTVPISKWDSLISVPIGVSPGDQTLWQRIKDLKWSLIPRGWIYQNMVTCARLNFSRSDGFDSVNRIIQPKRIGDLTHELETVPARYKIIAALAVPNLSKAWQVTAHNQTLVNETQIACALERYHLAHNQYPDTLDALVPQFTEKIPPDIIGGGPLHYRPTTDGKFLLYSIGWNETDDGGVPGLAYDDPKGDWVWQCPQK